MIKCLNKGCGKDFEPLNAQDGDCLHHPGTPVFHEGLKGWSCCAKKVVDFDAFLALPGCTQGSHSVKAPQVPAVVAPAAGVPASKDKAPSFTTDSGVEMYGTLSKSAMAPLNDGIVAMDSSAVVPPPTDKPEVVKEEELNDSEGTVVAQGTACKRRGCGHVFNASSSSSTTTCVFHSGAPVFHEGSKGWSCCPRKVLEFDEFLKIKGCKEGKHRFTDVLTGQQEEKVEVRQDWYQTQTHVILSLFAKKACKTKTKIVLEENKIKADIHFLDGKRGSFESALFQPIDPAASKFEILSTKIELNLKKSNGISWASIEPNAEVTSWTTFGTTGTVGTVGGKEAVIAGDAPISLLKK